MEYIVGIDLCRDFTQLCIFNNESNTVDSVALSSDRQSARVNMIRHCILFHCQTAHYTFYVSDGVH